MLDFLFDPLSKKLNKLPLEASRLFHGRGHCYEGLEFINIDWFNPVVWVVIYGALEKSLMDKVTTQLKELASQKDQIKSIIMQQRIHGKAKQSILYGEIQEKYFALENKMRFELNFGENQNIGFFLDAKPARQWVTEHATEKRVLNLFSYTCSFSVAALQGEASSVINIDMAKSAIATGQRNHAINQLDSSKVRFLPHDIFRSIGKLKSLGPYDLVIIDPPSQQKGSFEAQKDYPRLLKKLKPMLEKKAKILACLNAPYLDNQFLIGAFKESLPDFSFQERLAQRSDFPEKDLSKCLKMQVFHELS